MDVPDAETLDTVYRVGTSEWKIRSDWNNCQSVGQEHRSDVTQE